MNVDLHRALGTLADGGPHRTAPTDQLLARVHRRRAARAVTTGAVGMGTVAAVAIGAVALNGRSPVAGPDPATVGGAESAAPTLGPPSTTGPVPGEDALYCGSMLPDELVGALEGVSFDAQLPDSWAEGEVLTLSGQVDVAGEAPAVATSTVLVSLLRDGRVRATAGAVVNPAEAGRLDVGAPFTAEMFVETCGSDRLAPGEYTAVASIFYEMSDLRSGTLQVGAPITVTAWAADPAAEAAAEAEVSTIIAAAQDGVSGPPGSCGTTITPGALADDSLQVEVSMTFRPELPRPQSFYGHALVDNTGPWTVAIQHRAEDSVIVLTRDGVVVAIGRDLAPWIEPGPLETEPGSSWGLTTAESFGVCALPGSPAPDVPLPAGDYQAWAVLTATVTDQDGPAAGTSREVTVVSEPVDVTYR